VLDKNLWKNNCPFFFMHTKIVYPSCLKGWVMSDWVMYQEDLGLLEHDSICKEYADTDAAVPHYNPFWYSTCKSIRWGIPCGVIIMRMILNGPYLWVAEQPHYYFLALYGKMLMCKVPCSYIPFWSNAMSHNPPSLPPCLLPQPCRKPDLTQV